MSTLLNTNLPFSYIVFQRAWHASNNCDKTKSSVTLYSNKYLSSKALRFRFHEIKHAYEDLFSSLKISKESKQNYFGGSCEFIRRAQNELSLYAKDGLELTSALFNFLQCCAFRNDFRFENYCHSSCCDMKYNLLSRTDRDFFRVQHSMQNSRQGLSTSDSSPTTPNVAPSASNEINAVKNLKERLKDVIRRHKWFGNDAYLMRWLKQRQLNIDQTELAIRQTLDWRQANDIETLADNELDSVYPELARELPSCFIAGWSKNGQPIATINYDGVQLHYLIQKYGRKACERYMLQLTVKVDKYLRSRGSDITGAILIANFKDVSFLSSASTESISLALDVTKTSFKYFPDLLDAVYIINVGLFARILFKLLTPILSANVATVHVLGCDEEEWSKVLFKDIDPRELGPQFGGSKIQTKRPP